MTDTELDSVRHLINCYDAVTLERPAAVYITPEEKKAIIYNIREVQSQWIDGMAPFDLEEFLGCRVELHNSGRMCALIRDERGLTKVILCAFCAHGMVSQTPRALLGIGAPPTQYECSNCYVVWPTDRFIKEATERATRILKQSIKEGLKG